MSKAIDSLSKDLASGMSRRKAIWRFVTGLGAVGALGALTGKKALASQSVPLQCQILCNTESQAVLKICRAINGNNTIREIICNAIMSEFQSACLQAAGHCRAGSCAVFVGFSGENSGITTASYQAFVNNEGGFTCVPPQFFA